MEIAEFVAQITLSSIVPLLGTGTAWLLSSAAKILPAESVGRDRSLGRTLIWVLKPVVGPQLLSKTTTLSFSSGDRTSVTTVSTHSHPPASRQPRSANQANKRLFKISIPRRR